MNSAIKNPVLSPSIQNLSGIQFFQKLLPNAVGLVLVFGALAFFVMLITGAIQWITSGGDKANLEAARGRISSALVGLLVLFATFAIIKLIEDFFGGLNIIQVDLGPLQLN